MGRSKKGIQSGEKTTPAHPKVVDLVCFSHLRWDFVYQRPQHLMSRCAQEWRTFYVEEPKVGTEPSRLEVNQDESGVWVVVPHLQDSEDKEKLRATHRALMDQLFLQYELVRPIFWYYTPLAINYTRHLLASIVIYDCMDELSAFNGAPKAMQELEAELLQRADLVFTGGQSLFEFKKDRHSNVHAFPSSIDLDHFSRARAINRDPDDQADIPHPRLGFFGVIDERMDLGLLEDLASARPDWHLVLIGPVAKLEPYMLPKNPNIHYLGRKPYKDLPVYLSGWDVAIMPFALNHATRFISPTKTPEYLAGGKPVVSTPVRDVVRPYGEHGLIWIANTAAQYIHAVESALALNGNKAYWLHRVDEFLSQNSWDRTWKGMRDLIEVELCKYLETSDSVVEVSGLPLAGNAVSYSTLPVEKGRFRSYKSSRSSADRFDYLIVGAGFAGSVLAERLACGSGKKVLIIDRRPHIGGNAYDHYDEAGLLVHKYGPHIFHTNSQEVFNYLSRFTEWRPYEHRVLASVDGQLVPIPINLDTVNRLYGLNLTSFELEKFFESVAEPKDQILTSEDAVVSKIGRQLYQKFFRNYTRKQWDLDPSELDASVTSRVPIRLNRDDRYFTDVYQSMPLHGYTYMFENLLDHPNIKIMLNTDYRDIVNFIPFREMIYTGPIDEFFGFRYGSLPYRSLKFKFETLDKEFHQLVAVINYPNEHLYTRVTEFKHLTGQEHSKTSLVYEYPCSQGDPYYPIPRQENAELYKRYKALADRVEGVHFAGRLATYRYYNMDQVTAQALTLYARLTGQTQAESIEANTPHQFSVEIPCPMLVTQDLD